MEAITDKEFELLATLIKEYSGIHLKMEKKALMSGRLNSMLRELEMKSFMEFYEHVKKDKSGVVFNQFIDKMTTNHTYFMREKEHFIFLNSEVIPYLKSNVKDHDLRLWCAASSSGEEPYTLAMILADAFNDGKELWNKKLLATDISLEILDKAKSGIYSREQIMGIPQVWKQNYFKSSDKLTYEVKQDIKQEVIFRRFNLLEPIFPFKKKFHVIFCRNVMIYFDGPTKDVLIEKFYNHLEPGGYLFIGHSESIDRSKSKLKFIKPAVYRKI